STITCQGSSTLPSRRRREYIRAALSVRFPYSLTGSSLPSKPSDIFSSFRQRGAAIVAPALGPGSVADLHHLLGVYPAFLCQTLEGSRLPSRSPPQKRL